MALKIRSATKSTTAKRKPAVKSAAAKPAARKTAAKAPAKRTAAKKAPAKATAEKTPRRSPTPKVDQKTLRTHVSALKKSGEKLNKAQEAHQTATNEVHEAVSDAREAGVPMSIISDTVGISRQWIYKMPSHRGRSNGSKPKSAARKAVNKAASAKKAPAAKKTTARKPATKKTGRRPAIKVA